MICDPRLLASMECIIPKKWLQDIKNIITIHYITPLFARKYVKAYEGLRRTASDLHFVGDGKNILR